MPFWETLRLALDSMRGNAFRSALTMLGDFIQKPIAMQVETAYSQEQYDVILV